MKVNGEIRRLYGQRSGTHVKNKISGGVMVLGLIIVNNFVLIEDVRRNPVTFRVLLERLIRLQISK